MSVIVLGLNHRTMPLDRFERTTITESQLPKAFASLTGREHLTEAVVLSTCNRTEVYAVAERFHGAYQDIRDFLCEHAFLAPEDFSDHLYVHYDDGAIRHLFSVAAGLDSVVLGEHEILGQVRTAWRTARREAASGPVLNMAFRRAIEVGKRARTETAIARNVASVSQAAVAMASERLDGLEGRRVLVLGAGDMGEGMAVALAGAGVAEVAVANRTPARARKLAERVGGRAVPLLELPAAVAEADVLLTSTGARSIMVEHGDLAPLVEQRAGRPLLVVDIAVPRDVDPAVADLPGVTLLDMDDLRRFAEAGLRRRRSEVVAVQDIVGEELDRYRADDTARSVAPLVAALHEHAETLRQAELRRATAKLGGLDEHQLDVVEALTHRITAKLLHEPTVKLKELAGTMHGERLAEALRDLFDLYDD
jgi:glutamyl-tRNA reductase